MKFFTRKWYQNNSTERQAMRVFNAYTAHLASLQGKVPAEVIHLARMAGLDDGWIIEVNEDISHQEITLTMRCGNLQIGYFDLTIFYDGASISPCDRWILARLARETDGVRANTDLAYHELDITADGKIEHRYIFHPGRWFAIRCDKLTYSAANRPNRTLPLRHDRFPGGPRTPPFRHTDSVIKPVSRFRYVHRAYLRKYADRNVPCPD